MQGKGSRRRAWLFYPFGFSTTREMGKAATVMYKHLVNLFYPFGFLTTGGMG